MEIMEPMETMVTPVEFNFTYAPGITDDQILGVELAGEMWSRYFGDTHQYIDDNDVLHIDKTVINLHVEIGSDLLPDNVIGGSFPAISSEYDYEDIYDAINGNITTDNDRIAADSLLDGTKTKVLVNGETVENDKFQLTKANLKALDLIHSDSEAGQELDGYIVMSDLSNFNYIDWNYDYLGGPQANTLDFLTTITHEIGHALGFISGTDGVLLTSEILEGLYQTFSSIDISNPAESKGKDKKFDKDRDKFYDALEILHNADDSIDTKTLKDTLKAIANYLKYDEEYADYSQGNKLFKETQDDLDSNKLLDPNKLAESMTSLDLFRYSTESLHLGANELTRGTSSYFSLDGSSTDLAMSNGQDYQASHWQNREQEEGLGVMNPTISLNERWEISENDLMALDAIGWDVNYDRSLDMQALYNKALAKVDSAWIGDRHDDVEEILDSKAYEGRRSSRGRRNITVDGYFSTFNERSSSVAASSEREVVRGSRRNRISARKIPRHWHSSVSNNFDVVETADNSVPENSVQKVDVVMLEMNDSNNDSNSDDRLLDKITGSLNTGLEGFSRESITTVSRAKNHFHSSDRHLWRTKSNKI